MLTILAGPFLHATFLGHNNRNTAVLKGISVDHALGNERAKSENVLNLFGSDVLALRELKDVLAAVNNADGSIRVNESDIAGSEPAILVESFGSLVGSLVVTGGNSRSHHAKLTTGVGLVRAQVLHLGHILESPLDAAERSSNVADNGVSGEGD